MDRGDRRAFKPSQIARRSRAGVRGISVLTLAVFTFLLVLQLAGPLSDEPWPAPHVRQTTIQVVHLQ